MKIALVKRRYSLRHGGSERYCVNLARGLTVLGHEVTVIGERIDEELAGDVEFIAVPVNRLTSWTGNRSFAENCGEAVRRRRFDVVYGLGRAFGLDAVRVTERLQAHWVNVRYKPWLRRLQKHNPRHRTLIDLERRIYRSDEVRRIVTQSQLDRRLVQEYYGIPQEKLCTIYNGVDTARFHPGVRDARDEIRDRWRIPRDVPLLLFASMDFAGKGLGSILRAMGRLSSIRNSRSAVCHSRLLVLGAGPIRRFRRLANALGVGDRVVFAGRQGGIERYYGAADLFLLPTAYEPFPNVNLESLACGTPVVTTATHGSAEFIIPGETGYLLTGIHAVDEIADHIATHLSLPDAAVARISSRCRRTAEQLPFERNVRETLQVLQEVARERTSDVSGRRSEVSGWGRAKSGTPAIRNSESFDVWDEGRLIVNPEFGETLSAAGLTTFEALMRTDRGETAKDLLAERKTFRIDLPQRRAADGPGGPSCENVSFYLKRITRSPLKEYVKPLFRLTRPLLGARPEWNAILEFRRAGIPTMVPVALGEDGGESLLLTRGIERCVKLSEWAEARFGENPQTQDGDDPETALVVDDLAELARRMHAAKLHHQDFYLTHLLLPTDDRSRGIHVIDLGRARKLSRPSSRWIVKDLGQLLYSARMLPKGAQRRFLERYFARPIERCPRGLLRRIEYKAARIARHSAKHRL